MENNNLTKAYLQNIQKMEDNKLLLIFTKRGDYTHEFLKLAEKEAVQRGYDYKNIKYEDIDKLVFQHKSTEELVGVVSDESNEHFEVELAIAELKERGYDLAALFKELEDKRKKRKRGNVGGCMFTFNGIGYKLYGREEQGDGTYIATEWVVFAWVPFIPVASYLVLGYEEKSPISGEYELNRVPLNWKQVRKTYLIVLLPFFLAFLLLLFFSSLK